MFEARSGDGVQLRRRSERPEARNMYGQDQENVDGTADGSSTMCGSRDVVEGYALISVHGYASGR